MGIDCALSRVKLQVFDSSDNATTRDRVLRQSESGGLLFLPRRGLISPVNAPRSTGSDVSDDSQVFCFVTPCNTRTYPEVGALPVRKSWRGAFLFAARPTLQARFKA